MFYRSKMIAAERLSAPGDEYERTEADAKQLADQGIVEAVTATAAATPKRAAKR